MSVHIEVILDTHKIILKNKHELLLHRVHCSLEWKELIQRTPCQLVTEFNSPTQNGREREQKNET